MEILKGRRRIEDLSALSYSDLIFTLLKVFSEIIVKPVFFCFLISFKEIWHIWSRAYFVMTSKKKLVHVFGKKALKSFFFF